VTNNAEVTVGTNDELIVYVLASSCNYGAIDVLVGGMPLGGALAPIPGTSGVYMPGFLFSGTVESQSGEVSIPLTDPNASRLGLAAGDMVLTPGSRSGGSYSGAIDLISGGAAGLFGSGEIAIDLRNTGAPITFGYPGTTIASDFTASLSSQDGTQSFGARILNVDCLHNSNAPEPGTVGLLLVGLSLIAGRFAGYPKGNGKVHRSTRASRGAGHSS
jgi:hypothetical protein